MTIEFVPHGAAQSAPLVEEIAAVVAALEFGSPSRPAPADYPAGSLPASRWRLAGRTFEAYDEGVRAARGAPALS